MTVVYLWQYIYEFHSLTVTVVAKIHKMPNVCEKKLKFTGSINKLISV